MKLAFEGRGGLFLLNMVVPPAQCPLLRSPCTRQASFRLGKHWEKFCFRMFGRNADSIVLILLTCFCCREAEMRNSILAQVLDQSARARLSNLALVKPEKTKAVENYLIQMARYGQLSGKVSEQGLIEILEKVSQQTEKKTTVKFNRRKVMDSDEEDDY
uniref:Programmed cell death protein 5 n=1 Tax=Canis lupus familiaris TaxID=9615 RepID=A0A8P0P4A9_CANLF